MAVSDQNARFLAYVKKLDNNSKGFLAAHVHLSPLPVATKSRDNISAAITIFGEIKKSSVDANIFLLRNLDIVFLGGGISKKDLTKACEDTLSVFGNIAVRFENPYGRQSDPFTILNLDTEYDILLRQAEKMAGISASATVASVDGEHSPRRSITIEGLAQLKRELKTANINALLFNQPAYDISDTTKIGIVFFETYISIQALEEQLCNFHSVSNERWLFYSLTEDLDAAVLRNLSQPENIKSSRSFSLNLNISTISSTTFNAFDDALTKEQRSRIVIEVSMVDIFENMKAFKALSQKLRQLGYRICLDGLGVDTILHIDFEDIEADFAKIFWSNEIKTMSPAALAKITAKVKVCATRNIRFIMGRCDNADSVRYARLLGIQMAQGRLIDQLVKKQIPV